MANLFSGIFGNSNSGTQGLAANNQGNANSFLPSARGLGSSGISSSSYSGITASGGASITGQWIGGYPNVPVTPMSPEEHTRLTKTFELYQKMQLLNSEEWGMLADIMDSWIEDKKP